MAKGISIGVASDTREFAKGIKSGVIEPLEDAGKALDDVARDGDNAGDKLETAMSKAASETSDFKREQVEAGKTLQRVTNDAEKDYKSLGDVIERESKSAGKSLGKNIKGGTDDAREGLKDFKDESASTAREAAASFDGSAESIGDAFQEVAANALGGFGPLGAAAGIGVAIGVGAGFAQIEERAQQMEQLVGDLFDDMIQSGNAYASAEFINSKIADIVKEMANDQAKSNELSEDSVRLGLSQQTLLRAQAGDQEALNAAIQAENDAHAAAIQKINESSVSTTQKRAAVGEENQEHQTTIALYEGVKAGVDSAISAQGLYNSSVSTGNAQLDATKAKIADIASQMAGIGDKTIKIDADTTGLEGALRGLQGRTISVNVEGQITRIGNQVW